MNREEYLEFSNSKSLGDSQSTALYSAAKFSSVDRLVEDQDSMTFSDILRGDMFKTPQKSCYQLFPLPKGSPPTKSEVKEALDDQLGKRSDFERKFLDSHLEQYISKVCVKRSKRIQNKISPRGSIDADICYSKLVQAQDSICKEQPSMAKSSLSGSTKFEVSRQKEAKDIDINAAVDHKSLFQRIGCSPSPFQENSTKCLTSRILFQSRLADILDEDETVKKPLGVSEIVALCQNISSEALALIQPIREARSKESKINLSLAERFEPSTKNDSSLAEELVASSETLSLKNFPSSTRRSSASLNEPEELPEPLFILYKKFSKLDSSVQELQKMGRLSLWETHVSFLLKTTET
jgi:hypothetical protein